MIERQELHCHNCQRYVQFDIDVSMNGDYKLECPNCGHEHYRVVNDGIISDERWGSANSQQGSQTVTLTVGNMTCTTTSTFATYVGSSTNAGYTSTQGNTAAAFMYQAWMNFT